jgi:uncharacterized protein (TIGR02271 family)
MEHIVAIFETDTAADAAAHALSEAGIPASAIRRYKPDESSVSSEIQADTTTSSGGFWAWLLGEEDGIEAQRARYPRDHEFYERGMNAGRAVVGVTLTDRLQADRAATILEDHHPIRIDEDTHEQEQSLSAAGDRPREPITPEVSAVARGSTSDTEEVIPLKEEQVEVGKRTVDRGVTRVRRYVVENPVERDVTLHGERVTIERRRPVSEVSSGAFEERTVEVRESEEVPVVEKTAHVVEEVIVRKEETERKETVRDTVRREEVEVGDANGSTHKEDQVVR